MAPKLQDGVVGKCIESSFLPSSEARIETLGSMASSEEFCGVNKLRLSDAHPEATLLPLAAAWADKVTWS